MPKQLAKTSRLGHKLTTQSFLGAQIVSIFNSNIISICNIRWQVNNQQAIPKIGTMIGLTWQILLTFVIHSSTAYSVK